ncbi:hypothetical protein BC832DRAFT_592369 [Gaertneriomyces semiglobifer]|nr:hypothetical protein BC832DRAFT_592369 [Gaertneriomyces semiglobifer]
MALKVSDVQKYLLVPGRQFEIPSGCTTSSMYRKPPMVERDFWPLGPMSPTKSRESSTRQYLQWTKALREFEKAFTPESFEAVYTQLDRKEVVHAAFSGVRAGRAEQTSSDEITTPPNKRKYVADEGDLSPCVAEFEASTRNGDFAAAIRLAVLHQENTVVRNDNDRAEDLVEPDVLRSVEQHITHILAAANEKISGSAVSLLSVVRSLIPAGELDMEKLAEIYELRGVEGLLRMLEEILLAFDDDVNQENSQILLRELSRIDPGDRHVRWVCRKFPSWLKKQASNPGDSTERTFDLFNILPFAKLPSNLKLRHLTSPFIKKSGRVGENSAGELSEKRKGKTTRQHVFENFIDNIKTSVAQIRQQCRKAIEELKAHDLHLTPEMDELLSSVVIPSFHFWNHSTRFTILFNLTGPPVRLHRL